MHTRTNTIEKVDDDELKLAEIDKHPIGIILLYVQAGLGMILAIGLAYFLLPVVFTDTESAFLVGNVFAVIAVIFTFTIALIATIIYRQNKLIITDRNITQILQYGLFRRKVSQLNINNVEDVTSVQNGFLPTLFNYGTLKIETAGEQVNFHYTFCPSAGYYAKIILDEREKMLGQKEDHVDAINNSTTLPGNQTGSNNPQLSIKDLGAQTVKHASKEQGR